MDRRQFVTTLGISTVVPTFSALWSKPSDAPLAGSVRSRSRIGLNGQWERYVDGALSDVIAVPSSQRPLGFYELRREFLLPKLGRGERAVLHFDGITYYGEVAVNGKRLGTMGPYVPYEFEFTPEAKEGNNRVAVRIADLTPGPKGEGRDEVELGVNPGWEAYGGIIREVYAEVRPAAYIENVRLGYELNAGYRRAACEVRVYVSSGEARKGRVEVVVEEGQAEVGRGEAEVEIGEGESEVVVKLGVESPALWSPETPNLYGLRVRLKSEGIEDEWRTRTGFREVKIRGNEFEMNGGRVVLKGVCRHDMWKGEGFTLTRGQMEQDMRMIKELGCNFVRLVHYPHDRHIVELADELGLMVSEEPGYWGMDFTKMRGSMIELGYRIMERTIRRDWNSPSVFAWLLGNECKLTVDYLKEGKARCRKLDPLSRPVSFANDMAMEKAKPIYEQAGLDFFDQHIYTFDTDEFARAARFYGSDRPLTFTEWGGKAIGQSQIVMEHTVDQLLDLVDAKNLGGHMFWSWQDMRQYSRVDGEMHDGVLESGVVTEGRERRPVPYLELARLFEGHRAHEEPASTQPVVLPLRRLPWARGSRFTPIDIQSLANGSDGLKSWAAFESRMAKFWANAPMARDQWKRTGEKVLLWRESELKIAGVDFHVPVENGYARPLVLTPEVPEFDIPLGHEGTRLHILGQVTFPGGFPVESRIDEVAAKYTIHYSSGGTQEIILRNGHAVARANTIYQATRIDPEATDAQPALLFVKDIAREQYRILLSSHDLKGGKVQSISCRLEGDQPLAIFAVTVEGSRDLGVRGDTDEASE